jgi:hypothetical protein
MSAPANASLRQASPGPLPFRAMRSSEGGARARSQEKENLVGGPRRLSVHRDDKLPQKMTVSSSTHPSKICPPTDTSHLSSHSARQISGHKVAPKNQSKARLLKGKHPITTVTPGTKPTARSADARGQGALGVSAGWVGKQQGKPGRGSGSSGPSHSPTPEWESHEHCPTCHHELQYELSLVVQGTDLVAINQRWSFSLERTDGRPSYRCEVVGGRGQWQFRHRRAVEADHLNVLAEHFVALFYPDQVIDFVAKISHCPPTFPHSMDWCLHHLYNLNHRGACLCLPADRQSFVQQLAASFPRDLPGDPGNFA